MGFAVTENPETNDFTINEDIRNSLQPNSYLCFFDSSPLLPSKLLHNYLVKLNHYFNTTVSKERNINELNLKIILIRDKISQLSESITLEGSFYLEVKLVKQENY